MAKTVIDLENTGLVIGDLTFDWIKQISDAASVSQSSHTLTERGNGIYVYNNPNVTEDSDFRVHETADSTKLAVGILSPADGDIALDSTAGKEATLSTIEGKVDTAQADLDNPSQYQANVSSVALETTAQSILTETNSHPTLAEMTTVLAKEATLSTHESNRATMETTLVGEHDTTQALLGNGTYGLSALQVLLNAIDTSTELQARFDEIKGAGWTTETLAAIHTLVGSLDTELDGLATATELDLVKALAQQSATAAVGNYYVVGDQLILKDTGDVEIARWDLSPSSDSPTSKVRV